jgi:DNA polymerase-4
VRPSTPILAHLDLDAFFAAVEELENPELRDKPLVVGGDPRGRGVVSTANYVARTFGIARAVAAAVQTSVRATTSLTCSLGVSTSKVVCKIASDRRKPGGITVVPPGKEAAFLAPLPIRILPGVGPRAEERLARGGVTTIGALASLPDSELRAVLPGSLGPLLRDRSRGIDARDLELDAEPVSVSAEDTFATDVSERATLHAEIRRLSELVSDRLRRSGLSGRTVTAKLRYGDFSIRTRSATLGAAVDDSTVIGDVACGLLDRGLRDRPGALRLVGVGVSGLSTYRQLTLDER